MPERSTKSAAGAHFVETMECLPVTKLPEGAGWTYEIKLDGYRLEAVRSAGRITLYSRRKNVLNDQFPLIADALAGMPDATVIDGEVVAMNEDGRSDFNLLQNFRSAAAKIHFYAFDILTLKGKSLLAQPLEKRRALLAKVMPRSPQLSLSVSSDSASDLLGFVKQHGLEGVVAKRADSSYEPGQRSGLWSKYRLSLGQEFVVGGYTPGGNGFDAIIVGVYRGKDLYFAARVRAGFVPATRRQVFAEIKAWVNPKCPFVNLPEKSAGRFGQGLTAEKMKECIWVKPKVVVRIDFLEWTGAEKLRQTKYIGLREDKDPRKVVRET